MFVLLHVCMFETLAPSLQEQFQFNFKYQILTVVQLVTFIFIQLNK